MSTTKELGRAVQRIEDLNTALSVLKDFNNFTQLLDVKRALELQVGELENETWGNIAK